MTKKTYKQKHDLYKDQAWHDRAEMAVREAAFTYTLEDSEAKKQYKQLADGVLSNFSTDIEAVIASMVSSPSAEASITDDVAMEAAVQHAWSFVAPARYPGTTVTPEIKITSLVPPSGPPKLQEGVIEYPPPDELQKGIAPAPEPFVKPPPLKGMESPKQIQGEDG